MDFEVQIGGAKKWSTDAVVLPIFEEEVLEDVYAELIEVAPWLAISPALRDIHGKKGELVVAYGPPSMSISRAVVIGLGKREKLTENKVIETVRNSIGKLSVHCRGLGLENFGTPVKPLLRFCANLEYIIEEIICAVGFSLYRYVDWKSDSGKEDLQKDPKCFKLLCSEDAPTEAFDRAVKQGIATVKAVTLARNVANMPGNDLTPIKMAEEAYAIAQRYNMAYEALDRETIISLGMGAFASVASGSVQEPRLIILEYAPTGCEDKAPIVYVGKGITFDSGGLSIKPASKMWEMKCDMSGAGAVLALFEALGQLQLPVHVVGLLACAENMPDGKSVKPGDVVVSLSGKTIEIVNTDAEGRLVVCDTLTYAQNRWSPAVMIDIATLTGACVVALGDDVAGVFSSNQNLVEDILEIGEKVNEPFWPLPLDDRYFEALKSDTADFTNAGGREAGASTAAIFLKQFVKPDVVWAHLDIAGPAFIAKKNDLCTAGGTGFGVRTCIHFLKKYV